jgi:3D (Asp-Asp-Asp) domain-containing protein
MSPADGLATFQGQALIQSVSPETPKVVSQYWVLVTAYSSTPDQTDSTPFITASGTQVRDGVIACNFLRFGTRVRFPQLYGNKIFVVEDRMALRNSHKMDIWFITRWQAKQFGVKWLKVEVLET